MYRNIYLYIDILLYSYIIIITSCCRCATHHSVKVPLPLVSFPLVVSQDSARPVKARPLKCSAAVPGREIVASNHKNTEPYSSTYCISQHPLYALQQKQQQQQHTTSSIITITITSTSKPSLPYPHSTIISIHILRLISGCQTTLA